MNFYPRSPCGERLHGCYSLRYPAQFLSTLSLRRATTWQRGSRVTYVISIHALLAESDKLVKLVSNSNITTFLSTLSLRRATAFSFAFLYSTTISIHALLAESDPVICFIVSVICLFLSTLSLRRATMISVIFPISLSHFYPRSPCGERPSMSVASNF